MKNIKTISLLIAISLYSIGSFAQKKEQFKPSGKPIMTVFTNYHSTFSDGAPEHAFQITRAYFGYQYAFSKNLSAKIVLDFGDPGIGNFQLSAYLKNAYLNYKYKNLSINFGMIGTKAFKVQEKFWGYRYVYKSFQDAYKFNSSADLGFSVDYIFNKIISADVSVINGKGYKLVKTDSTFKVTAGLTLSPVEKLILRGYYDYYDRGEPLQTFAFFAGYSFYKFNVGAEYDYQKNHGFVDQEDFYGYSIFASFKANDKWKIFGRYDKLISEKIANSVNPWNFKRDGQAIIAGFEFNPINGIKISPNYQEWIPADGSLSVRHGAYLNCEIKL